MRYLESKRLRGFYHSFAEPIQSNGITHSTTLESYEEHHKTNVKYADTEMEPSPKLLVFSGADAPAVDRVVHSYNDYYSRQVSGFPQEKLEQLAYTLAARRSLMSWRTFCVVEYDARPQTNVNETTTQNGCHAKEGAPKFSLRTEKPINSLRGTPSAAFVFTGQGAQYAGMGGGLRRYPAFARSLKRSAEILHELGFQRSIIGTLLDKSSSASQTSNILSLEELNNKDRIHSPEVSQPLCTVLQIALVDLLRSFGIEPVAVIGHSSGEIAAAYTIRAISHEAACKVAYYRGLVAGTHRRMSYDAGMESESMMSVNLSESQIPTLKRQVLGIESDSVHLACVNSPTNVTLSGTSYAIATLKKHLDDQGVFAHQVQTGVAYHSPTMRSLSGDYLQLLGGPCGTLASLYQVPAPIPMISTVTGQIVAAKALTTPQYWVDNLISPVRFMDAIRRLQDDMSTLSLPVGTQTITDLIEIGPHSALKRPIMDTVSSLRYQTVLHRNEPAVHSVLKLVGTLFCRNYPVSVVAANNFCRESMPPLVDCPPYPFDHSKSYWNESRLSKGYRLRNPSPGYLIGKRVYDWNPLIPRWRNWMCSETIPWLGDHIVCYAPSFLPPSLI